MPGTSGVGISFGADRIYDVLNTLDLYPSDTIFSTKVLFVNFGQKEAAASLHYVMQLRARGISAELFPDNAKMKKQLSYANGKHVPYVAMVGETEMASGTITLKNMETGEQSNLSLDQVVDMVK